MQPDEQGRETPGHPGSEAPAGDAPDVPDRAAVAAFFQDLARYTMPFGRFAGRRLYDLPHEYLLWFQHQGFPQGKLGDLMRQVCTLKSEGADHLFDHLRQHDRNGIAGQRRREREP
jgi:uncharacterized protein (DUF3820 family)